MSKIKTLTRWVPAGLMAAAAVFFCPSSPSSAGEVLRIGGTGSAIGTMKRLASAYGKSRPDVRIGLMPSIGSSGAVKAVSKGPPDIGLIARPIKENEGRPNLQARK